MQYVLFIILAVLVLAIYFISDKALIIANSYEELDALKAHIFTILKERQNYIIETYPSLEVHELYAEINHMTDLNQRIELEFRFDFDDKSDEYLKSVSAAIDEYNKAITKHDALCLKYPKLNKIFKFSKHHKL